jgi:hypothetical protein
MKSPPWRLDLDGKDKIKMKLEEVEQNGVGWIHPGWLHKSLTKASNKNIDLHSVNNGPGYSICEQATIQNSIFLDLSALIPFRYISGTELCTEKTIRKPGIRPACADEHFNVVFASLLTIKM